MNTCKWTGSLAMMSGAVESEELSTGTSRVPISCNPSASAHSSMILIEALRMASSLGMKK